jgi:hypothetical protein
MNITRFPGIKYAQKHYLTNFNKFIHFIFITVSGYLSAEVITFYGTSEACISINGAGSGGVLIFYQHPTTP